MKQHNAADPEQVKKKAEDAESQKQQFLNDIKEVMKRVHGQRLLRTIIPASRLLYPSMTGNSWTYFNEGRRALGIELYHAIAEACPGQVLDIVIDPVIQAQRKRELKAMSEEGGVDL